VKLICKSFKFDGNDIELILYRFDKKQFSQSNYEAIITAIDPNQSGPDTWMEGDIVIYGEDTDQPIELGVNVIDILPHL